MRIRDATPADTEAIREVHAASIMELGTAAYRPEQVEAWARGCDSADYAASITAGDVAFVVAERADSIRGFGSLRFGTPEGYESVVDAEITGVYVDPSVVREGVGTRIYETLETRARSADVATLGLSASLNAVAFYESHGYECVRTIDHTFSAHESTGVSGDVVEMTKEL